MSDNTVATKMATEYNISMPQLNIPESSPDWVRAMYPALIKTMYEGFNGVLKKIIDDFNATFVEMQKQIDDLAELTKAATEAMKELKSQLLEKDYIIDNQHNHISSLRDVVDRNESYSRRENLIFGGISMGTDGTCTHIVYDILRSKFNIADPSTIVFVRCHYLQKPTNDRKGSIIARFQSFSQRMNIWNGRRCLLNTDFFLSEDFPSEISKRRNKLRPILKEASKHRQYEKCISLKQDKLFFDGVLYSCDNLHNLPVSIHPRTLSEKRSRGVLCFGGILSEYHEFSNFYRCDIRYRNMRFTSVEQAYQYIKAVYFNDNRSAYLILRNRCPTQIKMLGRNVSGFDQVRWNSEREPLMKRLIHEKFSQNPDLKQKLCDTGTMHLAEATKSDSFFGTGVSITNPTCLTRGSWTGSNRLGEALMDTRRELK